MNRRLSPLLACVLAAGCLSACSNFSFPDLHLPELPFRRHKESPAASQAAAANLKTNAQGLAVEVRTAPDPLKLGESRQMDVTVILRNTSKSPVHLNFPTGQTLEIFLKEPNTGKVLTKWSADRVFNPESRYLLINAEERLEFNEAIAIREMQPGKAYTVEAYFLGYEKELRATKAVVPQS